MAEWHISPDYIVNNWTDELLNLMVEKLAERKEKETKAISGNTTSQSDRMVSDKDLFNQLGDKIKVIKK